MSEEIVASRRSIHRRDEIGAFPAPRGRCRILSSEGAAEFQKGNNVKIKLSDEELEEFKRLDEQFREKFGRDMGPDDPMFFDPDADTPQPISKEKVKRHLVEAATKAGIHPRIIYAMNKTGLIVTEDTYHRLSEYKRRTWDDACAEYDERVKK